MRKNEVPLLAIVSVPPMVIFTITILLIQILGQFTTDGKEYEVIKAFLDFTSKDVYPDCTTVNLISETSNLNLSLSRNNEFVAFNQGPIQLKEQHLNITIDIYRVHIAEIIRDLMYEPNTYFRCVFDQKKDKEYLEFIPYDITFNVSSMEMLFINDYGSQVRVLFSLNSNKEIRIETLRFLTDGKERRIEISENDQQVIPNESEIKLSLDQLRKGVLTPQDTELTRALSVVIDEVDKYKQLSDVFNKLGREGDLAENIAGILK